MPSTVRAEQQALTRERLLDAGRLLFAAHGIAGTSLAQIAERAGVTTGAIYSNFSSKTDLVAAVIERHMARQTQEYRRLYSADSSAPERMQSGANRWMKLIAEEPDYFPLFIEVWRAAREDESIRERLRNAYATLVRELAALVFAGSPEVTAHLDEKTAQQFALLVCSLADGIALHKILDPASVPDDLFGNFLRVVIEGASTRPKPPNRTTTALRAPSGPVKTTPREDDAKEM